MNDILNDQSKRPTKGDAIKIDERGTILTCTVEMMLPMDIVVAKTPGGERILAVPGPTAESHWVQMQGDHDWNTPLPSGGRLEEKQLEVGQYVNIDLEFDDEGKTIRFGVMRGKLVAVDEDGVKRFEIYSYSLYADGDERLLPEKS